MDLIDHYYQIQILLKNVIFFSCKFSFKLKKYLFDIIIYSRGPPGSGKTSVGRELARLMNKSLIDIDDNWLEPRWKTSVASKLIELGDEQFLEAEGQELLSINHENHII